MKNSIIFLFLIIITSCSKENEDKNSLIGQWQIIEYCEFTGIEYACNTIEDGFMYHIKNDGTLMLLNTSGNCLNGSYIVESNNLILEYSENKNCSLLDIIVQFEYAFIDNNLKLIHLPPAGCDDGCYSVYNKIAYEE